MKKEELTYKDFKIGQIVTCITFDNNDFWDQHLTIGKKYKIDDVDFHFWDKICVPSDNKRMCHFVPIRFFSDIKITRKLKLEKLNKICSK